ncbi:zinc fingers and homeoboxes protein 3 isoform 1-T2 [Rhinophrynus dorsalis]
MASKRKSTTPCMIPLKTLSLERGTGIADTFKEASLKEEAAELPDSDLINSNNEVQTNGHENVDGQSFFCKYCNFGSHDTSIFVEHMDTKHLDFRDDPSYVCIACSFLVKDPKELEAHNKECHPKDAGLTWCVVKHESYTVVEQSLGDSNTDQPMQDHPPGQSLDDFSEITITKTPIMKIMKNKAETKKIFTFKDNANHVAEVVDKKSHLLVTNGSIPVSRSTIVTSSPVVNGSIISTVPVLQTGMTQLVSITSSQSVMQPKLSTIIAPMLGKPSVVHKSQNLTHSQQLPTAKSLPKVMIPLSSIPTYNASMDSNCFLKNSFNKFPYPTKAELCYLTVVTKYPEEQIKIWFTAQRLKQGISWSPEEIEDSRKKMFNTVIQSIPQPMPQPTITVVNAPLVANANNVQHLIQATLPGQIVSQPQGTSGLFVTQPIITNGIQGAKPSVNPSVSLTVTSLPTQQTTTQAKIASPATGFVDTSLPVTSTSPSNVSQSTFDPNLYRSKKSRQQLSALKNSFYKSQFPSHAEVARLTKLTGLSTRDVRKWFSDKRYHWRSKAAHLSQNSGGVIDPSSETMYTMLKESEMDYTLPTSSPTVSHTPRRQAWSQAPNFTTTKYKERAPEQLKALEFSFFQNNFPSEEEVTRLRAETKMTRREIDSWFSEKRKRLAEENKKVQEEEEDYEDDEEEEDGEGEDTNDEMKTSEDCTSLASENSQISNERKVNPIKINLKDLRVTESSDSPDVSNGNNNSVASDGAQGPSPSPKNKPNIKKNAVQRDILKKKFVLTQWPSNEEYDQLAEQTGLPRTDLVRWFGDCRYSFKNGQLRWYDRYRRGISDIKPQSLQPLLDYYKQHHTVSDEDLENLSEKSGMTTDEVKTWFAEKMEQENQMASDMGSDDPHSDCSEKQVIRKGTCDGFSEVSESSETWEPATQEGSRDPSQTCKKSSIQLEAD